MAELWNDIISTEVMQSEGFVVDYAVMTTYSLDMPTLLSVPFSLGAMAELTDTAMRSPHLLLEAVNRSADRFVVFCNAGSIAVPQTNNKIYSLLEQSVVQINLPQRGMGFVNFHPKVWIIKETNPDTGESQIKVVVLSRNLTGSNDLDIVCELIGRIGLKTATKGAREKHKPLMDFMEWLANPKRSASNIRRNIHEIMGDIERIEKFNVEDSPFKDYAFFPMGIDDHNGMEECLKKDMLDHAAEMVVISPFVDTPTLEMMTSCNPRARKTLITRHASISNEIITMFNDGVFAPKEVLTDKAEKDMSVDLHEKVYFVHDSKTPINKLYLGSTNATKNGFERNVEFILRLDFNYKKTWYDNFRKELIYDEKDCMFERVDSVLADNAVKEDASNEFLLRKAISAIQKTEIEKTGDTYSTVIYCGKKDFPQVKIRPYTFADSANDPCLSDGLTFKQMSVAMLTEFYVLSVGELHRMVKIHTIGMPLEERDRAIFRSFIDTPAKFISYLAFMLTDDAELFIAENAQNGKDLVANGNSLKEKEICMSLYENMVKMAYKDPERLKSIRSRIEKVDTSVIPEHFVEMYSTFEKALKQIRHL